MNNKNNMISERKIAKIILKKNKDDIRRTVVKSASKAALNIAQRNGAVTDGWSVFTVKNFMSKTSDALNFSTSRQARYSLIKIFAKHPIAAYGEGGYYDKLQDGIPKYVYIVGPDVSKRKNVSKHNVWICNNHQLETISKQLRETDPVKFSAALTDPADQRAQINNIRILSISDAEKWFSALRVALQEKNMNPKPELSNKLIPNLEYLDREYDVDSYTLKPQPVTVDDAFAEKYEYAGSFRGTAMMGYDELGQLIIIPAKGSHGVVERSGKKRNGTFTGKFENGAPSEGIVKYEDGTTISGKLRNVRTWLDPETNRPTFTYDTPETSADVDITQTITATDATEVIQALQQSISDMLKNNPDWIETFSENDTFYEALQYFASESFKADGVWDENMRNVVLLINMLTYDKAIFKDPENPSFDQLHAGSKTRITKQAYDNIIKYKTEKITS